MIFVSDDQSETIKLILEYQAETGQLRWNLFNKIKEYPKYEQILKETIAIYVLRWLHTRIKSDTPTQTQRESSEYFSPPIQDESVFKPRIDLPSFGTPRFRQRLSLHGVQNHLARIKDSTVRTRIGKKLGLISSQNNGQLDIKRLSGELSDFHSLRIGPYRALLIEANSVSTGEQVFEVAKIEHRRNAYG